MIMGGEPVLQQLGILSSTPYGYRVAYPAGKEHLKGSSSGVGCRLSKDLRNFDNHIAFWGTVVYGIDEGDGWLRLSSLPPLPDQHGEGPSSLGVARNRSVRVSAAVPQCHG